jgi:hypothetical protein
MANGFTVFRFTRSKIENPTTTAERIRPIFTKPTTTATMRVTRLAPAQQQHHQQQQQQ